MLLNCLDNDIASTSAELARGLFHISLHLEEELCVTLLLCTPANAIFRQEIGYTWYRM